MNAVHAAVAPARKETGMRLKDILAAPLYATARSRQWMAFVLFVLLAAGALLVGIAIPSPRAGFLALVIYAFGVGCLWSIWLPSLLLLARDGRQLGTPRIVRTCSLAAWAYALATVAMPVLAAVGSGGDATLAALVPALAVVGSLAFMLTPRWFSMWLGFLPAIYLGLHNAHHMPSLLDPRMQHWAWLTLVVATALVVVRWRQLLRSDDDEHRGWRGTMILQMRANAVTGDWSVDRQWAWRRPAGGRIEVDFRDVGPAHPARAISVALGGWYVPQTLGQRLRGFARIVLPLLLIIPVLWLVNTGDIQRLREVWVIVGVSCALWVGAFCAAMLTAGTIAFLARRWRNHADMALLALLPGTGGASAARHVVRAVSVNPAIGFVAAWLCIVLPVLLFHVGGMAMLLATLAIAGLAFATTAATLHVFAGRRLGMFVTLAAVAVLLILASASCILLLNAGQWGAMGLDLEWLTLLGWLLFVAWAAWRGARAWRVLQKRPHPFLVYPS